MKLYILLEYKAFAGRPGMPKKPTEYKLHRINGIPAIFESRDNSEDYRMSVFGKIDLVTREIEVPEK